METLTNNIKKVAETKKLSSSELIKICIPLLSPSRRRLIVLLVFQISSTLFFKLIAFQRLSAITIIHDITNLLLAIIIPIFTVLITGYAIFQALVNKPTTKVLLKVSDNNGPKLVRFNNYFFGITILYLFLIIINTLLLLISKFTPSNLYLELFPIYLNEWIASFFISTYVTLILFSLIEIKSFIYNLFQIFLTNATAMGIEILKDDKD